MRVEFKKVILHNFLSYGHSEIDLTGKGYCLVSGVNNCPLDRSTSNGSGKSTWISAICWALTGETVQGITKDIKNIYVDEDLCYVTLDFSANDKHYVITRYNKPKSDLKIEVNGKDESGKGIKESELALAQLLPDLDKDLISSVILLGQGLPNKLSSFTPSGRKELLEKLSKSDYMIEDVKRRILARSTELATKMREYEDSLLKTNTLISSTENQLRQVTTEIETTVCPNYSEEISRCEENIKLFNEQIETGNKAVTDIESQIETLNGKLLSLQEEKNQQLSEELGAYNNKRDKLVESKLTIKSNIDAKNNEINKIKSIKDVCPTCGRPFEGVVKPDTKPLEEEVNALTVQMNTIIGSINECESKHLQYVREINDDFKADIEFNQNAIYTHRSELNGKKLEVSKAQTNLSQEERALVKWKSDMDNHDKYWTSIREKQANLTKELENLKNSVTKITTDKDELQKHIDIVKKMDTLVKRDFRGYLLSNVIEFIDAKAKEYCVEVFGSNKLDFKLDGNNISISYCDKSFESLSGGEKQRVDLVLQFAIRDMMSKYLDFSSNILALDEIFDNLDAMATGNVLNLISKKLTDIDSLFIISHHSDELNIPYDTELTITKNEMGISEAK